MADDAASEIHCHVEMTEVGGNPHSPKNWASVSYLLGRLQMKLCLNGRLADPI